ncbi:MAG TPA: glycosyltransferase family 9 protein, partial [Thermoanaerobaculia bacterium]|nr:glycosyltransferase family 9 protein [Thermoanaerobaculia bacterium]
MRILFVRLSSFGDVVFALPAAKALRAAAPDTALAWAVEPPLAPLLDGAPFVDEVLGVNTRGWRRAPAAASTRREIRSFLGKGRAFRPDLVVDAQGLFKSALVTASVRAPRKVGFGWRTATERVNCLFTRERVEAAERPHVLDRMLALAEHVAGRAGFDRVPDVRHLVVREDPAVDAWLERNGGRPFALLQPFSSRRNKEWDAEDLLALAERLSQRGVRPVLRWGPGEESRAESLRSRSRNSPAHPPLLLAPPTTPASSARPAARAALFVGADTGPTPLPAPAAVPAVALFR